MWRIANKYDTAELEDRQRMPGRHDFEKGPHEAVAFGLTCFIACQSVRNADAPTPDFRPIRRLLEAHRRALDIPHFSYSVFR